MEKSEALAALVAVWQAALDEPNGILCKTSDFAICRAWMYEARANSGDPRLLALEIDTRAQCFGPEHFAIVPKRLGGKGRKPRPLDLTGLLDIE